MNKLRVQTKNKVIRIIDYIKRVLRWGTPSLVSLHQSIIEEYIEYLVPMIELDYEPCTAEGIRVETSPFRHMNLLEAWTNKCIGTLAGTKSQDIMHKLHLISSSIQAKDNEIVRTYLEMRVVIEDMKVKMDSKLSRMVHDNVGRKDRFYTIWYLANHGLIDILERFLKSTLFRSIDERDPDHGYTALMYASKNGNFEMVNYLLSKGAKSNIKIADGRTALHLAAAYGSKKCIYELLSTGDVFVTDKDDYGCTPLDLAIQNKNEQTIYALERWDQLLPPEDEELVEVQVEEDVPEEYTKTPIDIVAKMSPKLRILTKRLQETNGGVIPNPLVEIRLCEKHATLCMIEGFKYDAVKSLRRRWLITKRLIEYNDDPDVTSYSKLELPTEIERMALTTVYDHSTTLPRTLNNTAAVDIGRSFAEELIKVKLEGYAVVVLKECLRIQSIETTKRIAIIARIAETQLFIHDLVYSKLVARRRQNSDKLVRLITSRAAAHAISRKYMYELDEAMKHGEFSKLLIIMGQYTTGQKEEGVDADGGLATILLDNMHLLHYALSLHDSIYARDIVEPCTLAPLLELLAEGAERQGLLPHALSIMKYAQRVCERTLGVHDEQSIRISFQVLRLQLRASSTPEGYKIAAQICVEITHNIDVLSRTKPLESEKLTTQAANLLAISKLFEDYRAHHPIVQKAEELVVYPVPTKDLVKQSRTSSDKLVIVTGLGGVKLINSNRKNAARTSRSSNRHRSSIESMHDESTINGDAIGSMSARLLSQPSYNIEEVRHVFSMFDTMKQSHIEDMNSQNSHIIQGTLTHSLTLPYSLTHLISIKIS